MSTKDHRKSLVPVLLLALASALTVGSALAAAPVAGDGGIVFTYQSADAETIYLAGDFNGWNAEADAMTRQDGGLWSITKTLTPGSWQYKFVVDGVWVEDPDNPESVSDPFGGANSLITVQADGSLTGAAAVGGGAAAAAADIPAPASADDINVGAPRSVSGGVEFTYHDRSASTVVLAGNFNGWNADELPLASDGKGNWIIVHPLPAGTHEYKFVVDGGWFADPENPDTQPDPYGGANSVVTVDDDGNLVAVAADAGDDDRGEKSNLNARLYLSGRYLTRFELAKNVLDDPRYRLQRPSQSVDLNFDAEVSDVVETFFRLRLDSDQNIIQNNIAGFLDEANLHIHPGNFDLTAYWNQETYTSDDVMMLSGNIDHPGTIGHDHLQEGKGTAGTLFEADPWGINLVAFLANVHNHDYYGDPDLYDNTGQDKISVRLAKELGRFEVGLPVYLERTLIWLDFSDRIGQSGTGIPALDEHILRTGDQSVRYETSLHTYNAGLDLRYRLSDTFSLAGQGIYVDFNQRIVTGENSGDNNSAGQLDLPFLERNQRRYRAQLDVHRTGGLNGWFQHTWGDMKGATEDQVFMELEFLPQDEANKKIYFDITDNPAQTRLSFTELDLGWKSGSRELRIWAWHRALDKDYGAAGRTVPGDTTRTTADDQTLYVSGKLGAGSPEAGLGHTELEFGLTYQDPDKYRELGRSYEFIFRYDRDLSRTLGVLADLRWILYDTEGEDHDSGEFSTRDNDYFNPFVGLRYRPIRKLDLILGYGVDPVNFSIDYDGRQTGRWLYREQYMYDHPDADVMDAETHLAKARVFTLRAQFLF